MNGYKETHRQTPNVSGYAIIPKGIVLHHTGGGFDGAVAWLTNPASGVSAHVVIAKTGERKTLATDIQRTWHSGKSAFGGYTDCNSHFLGVEFEGDTNKDPLTCEQIESLVEWALPRIEKYAIRLAMITDHRTVQVPALGQPGSVGKVDLAPAELARCIAALAEAGVT